MVTSLSGKLGESMIQKDAGCNRFFPDQSHIDLFRRILPNSPLSYLTHLLLFVTQYIMATAFGILTGIIGLVSFTQDNLETSGPSGATVSIMVGRDGINSDNYGGQIRRVDVFDAGNEYLGQQLLRNSAPAGGYISMTANQNVATIQAQYASITAGDDDICIAAVSLIQADASELGYGWLGDVGMECDVDGVGFAPNRQAVGNGEDGNVHFPFCTW